MEENDLFVIYLDEYQNQKGKIISKTNCILLNKTSRWDKTRQMFNLRFFFQTMLLSFVIVFAFVIFNDIYNNYNMMETAYNNQPSFFGFKTTQHNPTKPTYYKVSFLKYFVQNSFTYVTLWFKALLKTLATFAKNISSSFGDCINSFLESFSFVNKIFCFIYLFILVFFLLMVLMILFICRR